MASILRELTVPAHPDRVWDAVRDVGHAHERLFPGVLTDVQLDGDVRVVTFADGRVVREPIVAIDDHHRRVAWTVAGGPLAHHAASIQVLADPGGGSRVVWITDVLPDAAAPMITAVVAAGAAAMATALTAGAASAAVAPGTASAPTSARR
jgi:hypothetical protein